MKARLINEIPKTYAIVFQAGDEAMSGLEQFAREQRLSASQFTAIGAFNEVTLGFFVPEKKEYNKLLMREQVEVLSLIGDVTLKDNEPQLHAHVVVGKLDGTAHGGHLLNARVNPTLEVVLVESPKHLHRKHDPETGLSLIDLEQTG
jgi:uncharacterized protein